MAQTQAPRMRRTRRVALLIGCAALVVLAGAAALAYAPEDPFAAYVDFAPSVSYSAALRTVTDMGLQTALPCYGGFPRGSPNGSQHLQWMPMGDQDLYQTHSMWVVSTPVTAAYWLLRLRHASGVTSVQSGAGLIFSCPALLRVTSPDQAGFLNADQAGTYIRLTFDTSQISYADALASVDDLGFRLARPCYEHSATHSLPLLWPMTDQSAAFAASHALIVATTIYASTTWLDQLQATPGVVAIQAPAATICL
jgi:hypothetical protein